MFENSSFYGNKDESIRKNELKVGYLSYQTLADLVGDMILCNNMQDRLYNTLELESGKDTTLYNGNWEEIDSKEYDRLNDKGEKTYEEPIDIYQYYIISEYGAKLLENNTDEIIFYDNELDVYVWGITHFGTSWSYVFTDIPIKKMEV